MATIIDISFWHDGEKIGYQAQSARTGRIWQDVVSPSLLASDTSPEIAQKIQDVLKGAEPYVVHELLGQELPPLTAEQEATWLEGVSRDLASDSED